MSKKEVYREYAKVVWTTGWPFMPAGIIILLDSAELSLGAILSMAIGIGSAIITIVLWALAERKE